MRDTSRDAPEGRKRRQTHGEITWAKEINYDDRGERGKKGDGNANLTIISKSSSSSGNHTFLIETLTLARTLATCVPN